MNIVCGWSIYGSSYLEVQIGILTAELDPEKPYNSPNTYIKGGYLLGYDYIVCGWLIHGSDYLKYRSGILIAKLEESGTSATI